MSDERIYPPVSEGQWEKILDGRTFKILVKPEQLEWAGARAVRCITCTRAGGGGGDPWRAYCLEHRCMVSNMHPKLCRQYTTDTGLRPYAPPAWTITSAVQAGPVRGAERAATTRPAGAGVRDTSVAAYRAAEWNGKLTRQQRLLAEFMHANRQRNYTRQELAAATGLGINVICGRVNELMRAPLEFLIEREKRACRITGETAAALELVRTDFMQRAA